MRCLVMFITVVCLIFVHVDFNQDKQVFMCFPMLKKEIARIIKLFSLR